MTNTTVRVGGYSISLCCRWSALPSVAGACFSTSSSLDERLSRFSLMCACSGLLGVVSDVGKTVLGGPSNEDMVRALLCLAGRCE